MNVPAKITESGPSVEAAPQPIERVSLIISRASWFIMLLMQISQSLISNIPVVLHEKLYGLQVLWAKLLVEIRIS